MGGTATGHPAKMTVPAEFDRVSRLSSRCGQRPLPIGRIMAGIWRQARRDAGIGAEAR